MKVIKDRYSLEFEDITRIAQGHSIDIRGCNYERGRKILMKGLEELIQETGDFLYKGIKPPLHECANWLDWPRVHIKEARCCVRIEYIWVRQSNSTYGNFVMLMKEVEESVEGLPWRVDSLRRFNDDKISDLDRKECLNQVSKAFCLLLTERIPGMDTYELKEWVLFLGAKKIALEFEKRSNTKIMSELQSWADKAKEKAVA